MWLDWENCENKERPAWEGLGDSLEKKCAKNYDEGENESYWRFQCGRKSKPGRVSAGCWNLELLEELASRAGDINATRDAAFTVLGAFHDPGRFAALGAIRGLGRVHLFLTVSCFCDLCHGDCP